MPTALGSDQVIPGQQITISLPPQGGSNKGQVLLSNASPSALMLTNGDTLPAWTANAYPAPQFGQIVGATPSVPAAAAQGPVGTLTATLYQPGETVPGTYPQSLTALTTAPAAIPLNVTDTGTYIGSTPPGITNFGTAQVLVPAVAGKTFFLTGIAWNFYTDTTNVDAVAPAISTSGNPPLLFPYLLQPGPTADYVPVNHMETYPSAIPGNPGQGIDVDFIGMTTGGGNFWWAIYAFGYYQ